MPRKETHCARGAGHPPPGKTPQAMALPGAASCGS